MSDLLDRMREAVTTNVKIDGIIEPQEIQAINDACLRSLMEMVRADERERMIQKVKNLNSVAGKDLICRSSVIEAIIKED